MTDNRKRNSLNAQAPNSTTKTQGTQVHLKAPLPFTDASRKTRDDEVDDEIEPYTSDVEAVAVKKMQPTHLKNAVQSTKMPRTTQHRVRPGTRQTIMPSGKKSASGRPKQIHALLSATAAKNKPMPRRASVDDDSQSGDWSDEDAEDEASDSDDELGLSQKSIERAAEEQTQQDLIEIGDAPAEATAPLTQANLVTFAADSNGYASALQEGYHAIIKMLWKVEKPLRIALDNTPFEMFDNVAARVLATVPTCLLREVIANNLAHAHLGQRKPDVVKVADQYNNQWALDNVAVIYQLTIASPIGRPPTAKQWKRIYKTINIYRQYKSTDQRYIQLAYDIDRIGHPQQDMKRVQYGARRYIPPPDENKAAPDMYLPANVRYKHMEPSPTKMKNLVECATAIKARVDASSEDEYLAMTYVGYTMKASARWATHDKNPSNYLMGLCLAAARYQYPEQDFRLAKNVVVPLASEDEAPIAEILICALANSYHQSGFGFNMADAGDSVNSIQNINPQQWMYSWAWINKYSPRKSNLKQQVELLRHQIQQQTEKIQTLEEDILQQNDELRLIKEQSESDKKRNLQLQIEMHVLMAHLASLKGGVQEAINRKIKVENDILQDEIERGNRIKAILKENVQNRG